MARLVVRQAPDIRPERVRDTGREYFLNSAPLLIGRAREAGLSLNSSNVSKRHAEIVFKRGVFYLRDLQSTQGTTLNGSPVGTDPENPVRLKSGDRIVLADTILEFIEELPVGSSSETIAVQAPHVIPIAPKPAPIAPPQPVKIPEPPAAASQPSSKKGTQLIASPDERSQKKPSGRSVAAGDDTNRNVQQVILVLDGSGSMAGEPIAALKAGVAEFLKLVRQDATLRDSLDVSIVLFGSEVKVLSGPFAPGTASEREMTAFKPSGLCILGSAIREASRIMSAGSDRRKPPLIFIGIDGVATDNVEDSKRALHGQNAGLIVACEFGELGDASSLTSCTHKTLTLRHIDKASFENLARWLNEVVKALATSAVPMDRTQFKWPPLPENGGIALRG